MKRNLLTIHAPEDSDYNQQLQRHLSSLEEEGLITRWDVGMVLPGMDLQQAVEQKLKDTQVVIVLLSADFVASDNCELLEQQIFSLQAKYKYTIVPVLLRPCLYGERYKHYNLLPDKDQAVTSNNWSNTDEALAKVAASIAQTVRDIIDGKSWVPPKAPSRMQKVLKKYTWLILGAIYFCFAAWGIKALLNPKKNLPAKLDLQVSDLRFTFLGTKEGKLFADIPSLTEVQVNNFEDVVLPVSSVKLLEEDSFYQPATGRLTIKPKPDQSIPALYLFEAKPIEWIIPNGNKLWLSQKPERPFYLESTGAPITGKFLYQDSLELLTENSEVWEDQQKLLWDQDIEAVAKSEGGAVFFKASAKNAGFFLNQGETNLSEKSIVIDSLNLTIPSNNEAAPFKSTLLSGSIEISGRPPILLEENSIPLIFPKLKQPGLIHQLTVRPDAIDLSLEGQFVSIYQMTENGELVNLHPPLIAWLWAHHKLRFFLYSLLIVLPLLIGVVVWRRS